MKILIVVVIYNKPIREIKYIDCIKNEKILIYDNSFNPQIPPANTYYYHNKNNDGVSAAYNYGVELAKKFDIDFLILLDQDTSFDEKILETYTSYANEFGNGYIYAPIVKNGNKIYSPFIEGKCKNHPQYISTFKYEKVYNIGGMSLINSGMMVPLNLFYTLGNFNEKIKLDFSDTYFIEKYKNKHNQIILINALLEHKLSGDEEGNSQKELNRYCYYCNGAKELKKSTNDISRLNRLVLFRMIRLITKYKTLQPILLYIKYYLGDKKI